jgi:hypothetical protein
VTSFSENGRAGVLNGYVTNPNPTPTLTPNPNLNSNSNPNPNPNPNPNQINEKSQKETTLEIDQITKCQFGRWKLVKTAASRLPKMTTPSMRENSLGTRLMTTLAHI